jgi:hypothetical protein
LSRKGALSRDKPPSLTRWRWKRFWFSVLRLDLQAPTERDRERQRSFASSEPRPTKPGQGSATRKNGGPRDSWGRKPCETSCAIRPKLEPRRQARAQPEPNCRAKHGGSAPLGRNRSRSGKHPAVFRSASYESGSRAIHGCSCRESVAEVGKKHLVRTVEGSREANQEGAG